MLIDSTQLPTPVAQICRRLNTIGLDESADTFLIASNVQEVALKATCIALYGVLRDRSKDHAYRLAYRMIRASGLGDWERVLHEATSGTVAGFLPPHSRSLAIWATQNRNPHSDDDAWYFEAASALGTIFSLLGLEAPIPDRRPKVLNLISALVQLRNKTKAHGAVGPTFFEEANPPYVTAIRAYLEYCPALAWTWWHLGRRSDNSVRAVLLRGHEPTARGPEIAADEFQETGIYIWPPETPRPCSVSRLLPTDAECREFLLPNGAYDADQEKAEFLDYFTTKSTRLSVPHFTRPPAPLPASETAGLDKLEVHTNVFGNLPPLGYHYIPRPQLEAELVRRLKDGNHHIITLHGRGGIGKTSLALWVAHQLAQEEEPHFDALVWFSARDVDLKPTGPRSVRPAVLRLADVARLYGGVFETDGTEDAFAEHLRKANDPDGRGRLFIFDNFETMEATREIQAFLDTHTHLPNKVLITSRERAFKADFPIEVQGMERQEAAKLLQYLARELAIEGIVTPKVVNDLYQYSEGHPYVLRVMAGEIAKEGSYVPPKSLMPRRMDIVDAVFERSFDRLSDAGRRVLLTVANWRSPIAELALLVVLGQRGLDVEQGVNECLRLSLVTCHELGDDARAYSAPQLARVFGGKKMEGDEDRLLIEEDLEIIRKFGVLAAGRPVQTVRDEYIRDFTAWCVDQADTEDVVRLQRLDEILERLAHLWVGGWRALATFRQACGRGEEEVAYALRRAVEENPVDGDAWLARAEHARAVGDESTWIASEIRAAELRPDDVDLLTSVSQDLNQYIASHKVDIPTSRRAVYLASVRELMEEQVDKLSATGLSRLAWLHLHEENQRDAYRFAAKGLELDPRNQHCWKICERAEREGWAER